MHELLVEQCTPPHWPDAVCSGALRYRKGLVFANIFNIKSANMRSWADHRRSLQCAQPKFRKILSPKDSPRRDPTYHVLRGIL